MITVEQVAVLILHLCSVSISSQCGVCNGRHEFKLHRHHNRGCAIERYSLAIHVTNPSIKVLEKSSKRRELCRR